MVGLTFILGRRQFVFKILFSSYVLPSVYVYMCFCLPFMLSVISYPTRGLWVVFLWITKASENVNDLLTQLTVELQTIILSIWCL